jgi:hypothetical protein
MRKEDIEMSWKWEFGNGYYFCDQASLMLRQAALYKLRVAQFASTEFDKVEVKKSGPDFSVQETAITVSEFSRGVKITLSEIPVRFESSDPIQSNLINQLSNCMDKVSIFALKSGATSIKTTGLNRLIPKGTWTEMEALLGIGEAYLAHLTKPYDGRWYIGIGGRGLLKSIREVNNFGKWQSYLREGDILFEGEIGSTNNMRWIEYWKSSALPSNEAVMFGDGGLRMIEAQDVRLRVEDGVIAWCGVIGFGGDNVLHIRDKRKK